MDIPYHSDFRSMLREVDMDAVVISVPHRLLQPIGLAAAEHGKHILMEKPMAVTRNEARILLRACRDAGVRLMVNFAHRFRTEYHQASTMLKSGAIGRPVLVLDIMTSGSSCLPAWVWDPETAGGGMMMYNGVHSIDRLAWLASSPIAEVSAAIGTFSYPVDLEDNAVGTVRFHSGSLGAVIQHKSAARATPAEWRTMVYGTRGVLKVLSGSGLELVSDKQKVSLQVEEDNHFLGAIREFVTAIREERDPSPSGEDGVQAQTAVLALYEAARTRRSVTTLKEHEDEDSDERSRLAALPGAYRDRPGTGSALN
jgi:predicted dehydrogenase